MPIRLRPSRRSAACVSISVGGFLLTASTLIPTYAADSLVKIPLSIEAETVSTGTAELLDAAALVRGKLIVEQNVPITVNQRVTVQEPADVDVATLQSAIQMTRDDRKGSAAIVNASIDRSTVNRRTGLAVDDPIGSIQSSFGKPADPVAHEGLQFKFPFDTQKESYPYFDTALRASHDIDYAGEDELEGLPVYKFHQEIAPSEISGQVSMPASSWGREGSEQVTMKRFYGITRDLWVEPVSGAVVQVHQHYRQYLGTAVDDPQPITIIDVAPKLDAQTQSEQIAFASESKRTVQWATVYGPAIGAIVGIALLGGGICLGVTSARRRTPVASQPDPSAETEFVPAI
nr:DUF3068 domain-containing protein [Prescottella agglutinans]